MAVVPETPSLIVHGVSAGVLSVDPSLVGQDVGGTFTVAVDVSGVSNLVAYDITLNYANTILSAVSANFDTSTIVTGTMHFNVVMSISDAAGSVRYAVTLAGGSTVQATGQAALKVTFKVLAFGGSALSIGPTSQLVSIVNGVITNVPYSVVNGQFVVPPTILIVTPNGTVAPSERVRRLSLGEHFVDLQGFVQLSPKAPQAAFGGVIFDIVSPDGVDTPVVSSIAFMFPGDIATVTGLYTFGSITGTYRISVTPLRCTLPDQCVAGTTTTAGLFFKVKA
jgi:hypothetical protein